MQKIWDENTPGLLKIFYIITAKELAWRGNEGAYTKIDFFKFKTSNSGNSTGRIEYNPLFCKTAQGGSKRCANSKWLVANTEDDSICPVRLYRKILQKRPKNLTTDRFFLTPNPHWKIDNDAAWF
jgi:hypothetical protein